jgi:hypothetical protein
MPTISDLPSEVYTRSKLITYRVIELLASIQRPETWFEMIFGPSPKAETVPRYIYENKEEDSIIFI